MRYILATSFFLLFLQTVTATAVETRSATLSPEEYKYQQALYLFLTKDYLSSSNLSKEILNTTFKDKEKVILLLRLSDIELLYNAMRDYPSFTPLSPLRRATGLLKLLDSLYKMGDYEESLHVSRELGAWGTAHYFEGISLLNLNRLEESRHALTLVPEDNSFYPYARTLLAQIGAMRRDLKDAEAYLRKLLFHPSIEETGLTERLHILLGEVLFERELFSEASEEFLKIPFKSPFYREAVIGHAWSLVKMGRYEEAIPVAEEIKPILPYDTIEQDVLIILGYCYLNLGMFEEAIDHFQTLLMTISVTEERLDYMSRDISIKERYLSIFLDRYSAPLTIEEQYYISILRNDPALSLFLEEHGFFQIIQPGFRNKEREIIEKQTYIENLIKGLEEMLKRRDREINRIKGLLALIKGRMERSVRTETRNITFFVGMEEALYDLWQRVLNRSVDEEVKELIRFILQEWANGGIEKCSDSGIVCHVVNFLSVEGTTEAPEQIQEMVKVMEMIGNDLKNVEEGSEIEFERALSRISEKAEQRIKKGREAIIRLEEMKKRLKKNMIESERGIKESLYRLDTLIMEKFIKLKYELGNFKADVTAGLDAATRGMKELAIKNNQQSSMVNNQ
ncbi:MAG: tetratricopeptide repeat protein [Thermodesulfobacteriota bacterium]